MNEIKNPELKKGEWQQELHRILASPRMAEMTFHFPEVDKDKEIITADAMAEALEHYRMLPIVQEFHKERPVGICERAWQTQGDEFKGLVRFSEDPQNDDVWDKVVSGQYNQVSIAGRRTEYSQECNLHKSVRSERNPCRTTGLRLDSISVCDEAARNESTSLSVVKASKEDPTAFVYTTSLVLKQVEDTLIKADTTESNLMHTVTDDMTKKKGDPMKKCNKPPVKKGEEEEPEEKKEEMKEEEAEKEEKADDVPGSSDEEEDEKEEKAEGESSMASEIAEIKAILMRLVESDKKVHESMKADEKPAEEAKEEKKVEKAEVPPPTPGEDKTALVKAEMEQDFKKALDAAIAPVLTEVENLKKANKELADKLEAYGNETIEKSGIQVISPFLKDRDGKQQIGNAGACALQSQGPVKP